jgi:hypothetical protein
MMRLIPLSLAAVTICLASSENATASKRTITLVCSVETVEHLNCGGGLRPLDAPPPDCSNFVANRSLGTRTEKILVPLRSFRGDGSVYYVKDGATIEGDGRRIFYRSLPNFYTDAAGSSNDAGSCKAARPRR